MPPRSMDTAPSPRVSTLQTRLHRFLHTVVLPQESAINAALRLSASKPEPSIDAQVALIRQ